jgi:hypothetical protein
MPYSKQFVFCSATAVVSGVLLGFYFNHSQRLVVGGLQSHITGRLLSNEKPLVRVQGRFLWNQIADEDLGKYVGCLRNVECPNDATKFIIRGIVMRLYQAKVNEVFNPLARYWNSKAESDDIDKRIRAIRAEQDKLLASLGVGFTDQDSQELPAEKQSFVNKAAQLYPAIKPKSGASRQEWAEFLENRRARVSYLSQHLTPAELLDYRIVHDGNAQGIGNLLGNLKPTDGEFRKAFGALDGEDLNRTDGFMRPDLEAKLKLALGDERYDEYHQQTTPDSLVYNSFVQFNNLNAEQAQQLKELRTKFGNSLESKNNKDYQNAVLDLIGSKSTAGAYFNDPHLYKSPK